MWKDHLMHVKRVQYVLKRRNLCVNMSKCMFGKTSLVYLGFVVGGGQVKVDPSKVEFILNWPKPTTIIEMGSFLEVGQYYKKNIANFSYITSPLHAFQVGISSFNGEARNKNLLRH